MIIYWYTDIILYINKKQIYWFTKVSNESGKFKFVILLGFFFPFVMYEMHWCTWFFDEQNNLSKVKPTIFM